MKILQVTQAFAPSNATDAIWAYNLSRRLAERGHEVTVYTTDIDLEGSKLSNSRCIKNVDGVKVRYFRNLNNLLAHKYRLYLPLGMILAARKEISTFDIIHLHNLRTFQHIIVHHYAKKHGIPYVLDALGSLAPFAQRKVLKVIFDKLWGYRILKDAARVIAGTQTEAEEYKGMGVNQGKIVFISPAYDVQEFGQLPPLGQFKRKFDVEEKRVILFLGRLAKIKGIDFLVEAFHELARERSDAVLAIVGPDDGFKPTLERLVRELNITDKVLFTGLLKGQDKLSALVDADVLAQTSIFERGPGSPFEAVLCGTPIIVTKDTGAGDIVCKLDAGYLVEYGDVNGLRDLMKQVLDDPTEACIKTQKARQYILNNLDLREKVKEYEVVYCDAIRHSQPS